VQGKITYVGEKPGLAQLVKHCNQLLVATTLAATIEVITLAKKQGLDPRLVCKVVEVVFPEVIGLGSLHPVYSTILQRLGIGSDVQRYWAGDQ